MNNDVGKQRESMPLEEKEFNTLLWKCCGPRKNDSAEAADEIVRSHSPTSPRTQLVIEDNFEKSNIDRGPDVQSSSSASPSKRLILPDKRYTEPSFTVNSPKSVNLEISVTKKVSRESISNATTNHLTPAKESTAPLPSPSVSVQSVAHAPPSPPSTPPSVEEKAIPPPTPPAPSTISQVSDQAVSVASSQHQTASVTSSGKAKSKSKSKGPGKAKTKAKTANLTTQFAKSKNAGRSSTTDGGAHSQTSASLPPPAMKKAAQMPPTKMDNPGGAEAPRPPPAATETIVKKKHAYLADIAKRRID